MEKLLSKAAIFIVFQTGHFQWEVKGSLCAALKGTNPPTATRGCGYLTERSVIIGALRRRRVATSFIKEVTKAVKGNKVGKAGFMAACQQGAIPHTRVPTARSAALLLSSGQPDDVLKFQLLFCFIFSRAEDNNH